MRKLFTLFSFICLSSFLLQAQVYDMVVAKDGTGDYLTLKEAITAAGNDGTTIFIKKGTYREKVDITKKNVTLIGQSAESVIFVWNGSGAIDGTSESYTIRVNGENFYAENITFYNNYGVGSQAVALSVKSDKAAFKNCRLLSFQDTHYVHSSTARQYYKDCFIEGGTDFIFGGALAVFDDCKINCMKGGYYITAPSDNTYDYGLVFRNCEITANEDVPASNGYLGRPWKDNGKTVWLNCKMGSHIKSEGWSRWTTDPNNADYDNAETGYYAEYKSMDLTGTLLDVSARASWGKQLTDDEATDYTLDKIYGNKGYAGNVWDPQPLIIAPEPVTGLNVVSNALSWNSTANAKGYVITRNNKVIGFSVGNSYTDVSYVDETGYTYFIQAVGTKGNLSLPSETVDVNGGANDLEAPSVPENIKAKEIAGYTIRISWDASTDNEAVAGYIVYKDGGELVTVVSDLFYDDVIGVKERDKKITYTVSAFDDAGNESSQSIAASAKAKTALIDENFADWDEYDNVSVPVSVSFYGAGELRTADLEKCKVLPTRGVSGGSPAGTVGAIRLENGGVVTLSEIPSIEDFKFTAGTASSAYSVNVILEKYDGTTWIEVKTNEVGQLCNEYTFPELRQNAPIRLRIRNLHASVVYVHDIYANIFVPGEDPYPTDYKTGDILIDEHFNSQIWSDYSEGGEVLAQSVPVPVTILNVLRKIEITKGSKILPSQSKPGTATEATTGGIYLEKPGRDSYVVLPELPSCANITAIWCLSNSTDRTLLLEKYENDAWVTVLEENSNTSKRQGTLSYDFNTGDPIKLRLSNGNGSGAIYLHDLKVTAFNNSTGISQTGIKSFLSSTLVHNVLLLNDANDVKYVSVYSLTGQLLKSVSSVSSVDISGLNKGYYVVTIETVQGEVIREKILKY